MTCPSISLRGSLRFSQKTAFAETRSHSASLYDCSDTGSLDPFFAAMLGCVDGTGHSEWVLWEQPGFIPFAKHFYNLVLVFPKPPIVSRAQAMGKDQAR